MRGEANTETKPRSFLLDTEAPALTSYQGSVLQAVGKTVHGGTWGVTPEVPMSQRQERGTGGSYQTVGLKTR